MHMDLGESFIEALLLLSVKFYSVGEFFQKQ